MRSDHIAWPSLDMILTLLRSQGFVKYSKPATKGPLRTYGLCQVACPFASVASSPPSAKVICERQRSPTRTIRERFWSLARQLLARRTLEKKSSLWKYSTHILRCPSSLFPLTGAWITSKISIGPEIRRCPSNPDWVLTKPSGVRGLHAAMDSLL